MTGTSRSTYGPTPNLERTLEIAERDLDGIRRELRELVEETLPSLERRLREAGAPWTSGSAVPR